MEGREGSGHRVRVHHHTQCNQVAMGRGGEAPHGNLEFRPARKVQRAKELKWSVNKMRHWWDTRFPAASQSEGCPMGAWNSKSLHVLSPKDLQGPWAVRKGGLPSGPAGGR